MKHTSVISFLGKLFHKIPPDSFVSRAVTRCYDKLTPPRRQMVAARYLKGEGIEIGAMHNPTTVPKGIVVKYVDSFSREENLQRLPEVGHLKLVSPDFIEDGFSLPSFQDGSIDFVIANHVLEHAQDPFSALMRWAQILRASGKMFISVPLAERCFDKGRKITPLSHFITDYEACRRGDVAEFRRNTLDHYREWIEISLPAIIAMQEKEAPQVLDKVRAFLRMTPTEMLDAEEDIHFHTFSVDSFEEFLNYFCSVLRPDFRVLEISENSGEVIGVVERRN